MSELNIYPRKRSKILHWGEFFVMHSQDYGRGPMAVGIVMSDVDFAALAWRRAYGLVMTSDNPIHYEHCASSITRLYFNVVMSILAHQ